MDPDGYAHKAYFDGNAQLVGAIRAIRDHIEIPLQVRVALLEGLLADAEQLLDASNTGMGIADFGLNVTHNPIRESIEKFKIRLQAARTGVKLRA